MSALEPESVFAIARKDFQDAVRSKVMWGLTVLFVAFLAGVAFFFVWIDDLAAQQGDEIAAESLYFFLQTPVGLLIPLIGLLVGYKSIAGEADSGSIKILLSLPHSRLDVVLGKVLGRVAVLLTAIAIGLVFALVVILAMYGSFDAVDFLTFALLSMLLGAVYVCLGIAVSSMTRSSTRAALGIVGVFLYVYVLHDAISTLLLYLVEGSIFLPPTEQPDWYLFFQTLSPNSAYSAVLSATIGNSPVPIAYPDGAEPFFLTGWFAVLILLVWLIVPLALGYLRFDSVDL